MTEVEEGIRECSRQWCQEALGRALRWMGVTVPKIIQEGTQGQKSVHWISDMETTDDCGKSSLQWSGDGNDGRGK